MIQVMQSLPSKLILENSPKKNYFYNSIFFVYFIIKFATFPSKQFHLFSFLKKSISQLFESLMTGESRACFFFKRDFDLPLRFTKLCFWNNKHFVESVSKFSQKSFWSQNKVHLCFFSLKFDFFKKGIYFTDFENFFRCLTKKQQRVIILYLLRLLTNFQDLSSFHFRVI